MDSLAGPAALHGRTFRRDATLARASLSALAISVAMCAFGLGTSSLQLSGYGLAPSMPWPYYAGLIGLPLASAIEWLRGPRARGRLVALHAVLYVVIVWLTPLLIEGTPRFRTSYTNYGYVDPVLNGLGLIRDTFIYHNWPLFPVAAAELLRPLALSPYVVMAAFPLTAMLLYVIPVAGILRLVVDSDFAHRRAKGDGRSTVPASALWPAGLWVFAVFNWTNQDYFSPQALAFVFFLWWVYVLSRVAIRQQGTVSVTDAALVVGLFTAIVLSHVLTSIAAMGVLLALTVAGLVRRRTLIVTCTLVFMVWQVNAAAPFFVFYGDRLMSNILEVSDFFQVNLQSRVTGSAEHAQIALLRIFTTGLVFALGGLGALLVLRRRPWPVAARLSIAYLVGVALVAPVSLYGGEMLIRVLLFSLPLLGGLVVVGARWPAFRLALVGVLLIMAPLHILIHYGNELHDYVSKGEIAGFEYVAAELPPANLFGGYPAGNFMNTAQLDPRNSYLSRSTAPSTLEDFLEPTLNHTWKNDNWPLYVLLGRGDEVALQLFQNRHGFIPMVKSVLDAEPGFVRIYETPDFVVYRWDRPGHSADGLPSSPNSATDAATDAARMEGRPFTMASLLLVVGTSATEVARGARSERRLARVAHWVAIPLVVASLAVVAISGLRLAQIIGFTG